MRQAEFPSSPRTGGARARSAIGLLRSLLVLLVPLNLPAAPGDIDLSYGQGGIVRSSGDQSWIPSAMQPDGKVVSVAAIGGGLAISRVDADGRPDPAFGVGGRVEIALTSPPGLAGPAAYARRILLAPDGHIYLPLDLKEPGSGYPTVAVDILRLSDRGEWDRSYGDGGLVKIDPADVVSESVVSTIRHISMGPEVILADGSLVVVASAHDNYSCVIGYRILHFGADGRRLDFGADAYRLPAASCNYAPDESRLIALPSGGLLYAEVRDFAGLSMLQFDAAGRSTPLAADNWFAGLPGFRPYLVDASGPYVLGLLGGFPPALSVSRRYEDLSPDPSFGSGGTTTLDLASSGYSGSIGNPRLVPDGGPGGTIGIVGLHLPYEGLDRYVVARLLADGRPDRSFGSDGVLALPEAVAPLGIQSDASLLLQLGGGVIRLLTSPDASSPGLVRFGHHSFDAVSGEFVVRVSRSMGSSGSVSVDYRLAPRTARPGTDYRNVSGTLTWMDGERGEKTFRIPLVHYKDVGSPLFFDVVLEGAAPALLLEGLLTLPVTVQLNDPAPGSSNANYRVISGDSTGGGGALGLELPLLLASWLALSRRRRPVRA